jgi:hypothetical protein
MPTAYVFKYKFCRAVYYIIGAKHLSKAWRATVQVGEVRIIAFRPARQLELVIYFKYKLWFLPIAFGQPEQKLKQRTKS